jgi:hypothetical protein
MALAEPLVGTRTKSDDVGPESSMQLSFSDRRAAWLSVMLGAAFFGIGHLILTLLNGLDISYAPLVPPMGFVAGVGLSLALFPRISGEKTQSPFGRLLSLGTAATIVGLAQLTLIVASDKGTSITPVFGRGWYANFSLPFPWWEQVTVSCPSLPDFLSVLDAAAVGAVFTIGISIGLSKAHKSLSKRNSFINRPAD